MSSLINFSDKTLFLERVFGECGGGRKLLLRVLSITHHHLQKVKKSDIMAKKYDTDKLLDILLKNNLKMEFDKKTIKELGRIINDWIEFGFFNKAILTTTKNRIILIFE